MALPNEPCKITKYGCNFPKRDNLPDGALWMCLDCCCMFALTRSREWRPVEWGTKNGEPVKGQFFVYT